MRHGHIKLSRGPNTGWIMQIVTVYLTLPSLLLKVKMETERERSLGKRGLSSASLRPNSREIKLLFEKI
jgi:hypothetical protein